MRIIIFGNKDYDATRLYHLLTEFGLQEQPLVLKTRILSRAVNNKACQDIYNT